MEDHPMRQARLVLFLGLLGVIPAQGAVTGAEKKMERIAMEKGTLEKATFGAGCFWGVEAMFRQVKGVVSTQVGYTGGSKLNATYKDVCSGKTGHAEAVEVTYDPSRVSYETLLNVFWENHDPTTPNRQGPDVGEQYRSAIFFHTPAQESAAKASQARLEASRRFRRPVVTQIVPAGPFYRAEDYHQQYLEKRGLSTCHISTP